ncbi:MAG: hypothetical protein ACREO3_01185 [Arenimonas sp.]
MNLSPDLLPPIAEIRRIAQSLAMLDAVLSPEWDLRYYSFDGGWAPGEEMASMRNGSGDDWFLLFDAAGAALKGFAHELADAASFCGSIQEQVPPGFSSFLREPAFSMQHATFCYWSKREDSTWYKVDGFQGDDGSTELLAHLILGPAGYKAWAEDYFEVPVDFDAVAAVFAHEPLAESVIRALNPAADLDAAYADAVEIGFPRHGPDA